jgi:hypothetical protein
LQKIGFEMHRRRISSISIEECKIILNNELETRGHKKADIDELIDEMLYRSGLFRFFDDSVSFRHLLIQEFYAGRGVPSSDFLQSIISDEWWQRAIVFYFGENPDDYTALDSLITSIGGRTPRENFQAALTIGIALQACYLIRVKESINVFQWVIKSINDCKDGIIRDLIPTRPLSKFLFYYIFGREAVACKVLSNNLDEIEKTLESTLISQEENDLFHFWYIVGLIECNEMQEAEKRIKKFHPEDRRLLLAIHLGCFLLANLRVATKEQKQIAERIMDRIAPLIKDLKDKLLTEIKSELIEIRKGEIKAIERD